MSRQNNTKNKLGIYNNQIVKYITVHESNLINYWNNTVMERVNQWNITKYNKVIQSAFQRLNTRPEVFDWKITIWNKYSDYFCEQY